MSETWYAVNKRFWGAKSHEPTPFEVEKTTKHFVVTPNGTRRKKETDYEAYFDNLTDARTYALQRLAMRVRASHRVIEKERLVIDECEQELDRLSKEWGLSIDDAINSGEEL